MFYLLKLNFLIKFHKFLSYFDLIFLILLCIIKIFFSISVKLSSFSYFLKNISGICSVHYDTNDNLLVFLNIKSKYLKLKIKSKKNTFDNSNRNLIDKDRTCHSPLKYGKIKHKIVRKLVKIINF